MIDATGMPQSAVVLGAGSDLAQAVVRRLAERRLERIVLAGRDVVEIGKFARELEAAGMKEVEVAHFDVRAVESHEGFAADQARLLGEIDLVLAATGLLGTGALDELDARAVAELVETNFAGPAAALLAFAKVLVAQGHGQLAVFSSAAAMRVRRANFVYGSAKAGLDGFCQGLGDALAGSGVGVLTIRPGFVPTKMTAGRPRQPFATDVEHVAAGVVRALERRAEDLWVPGLLRLMAIVAPAVPRRLWRSLPT